VCELPKAKCHFAPKGEHSRRRWFSLRLEPQTWAITRKVCRYALTCVQRCFRCWRIRSCLPVYQYSLDNSCWRSYLFVSVDSGSAILLAA